MSDGVPGVKLGVAVNVAVGINVDVGDGVNVNEGVSDGVNVRLGVSVAGWKNVGEALEVAVAVGVDVGVNVFVAVPVTINGVRLRALKTLVGVSMLNVAVYEGVGVVGIDSGASASASHPMQ